MSKKIGRYIIEDNFDTGDEINTVEHLVDDKNSVLIKWAWPRNISVKLAVVFDLPANDNRNLESLINDNENFVLVTKEIDKNFSRSISGGNGRIYKIFPGKFGEGSDIILINQAHNNTSKVIYKKVKVTYKIIYNNLLFSGYKKASIEISCSDKLDFRSALYYVVSGKKTHYPLEEISGILYIARNEEITINVSDAYKDKVELYCSQFRANAKL